jgi:hypothetical protein
MVTYEAQPNVAGDSMTETALAPEAAAQLTAQDRCDQCGAQAYIRVGVGTSELLFCAHHGHKYQEKLSSIASSWHDESEKLFEQQAH